MGCWEVDVVEAWRLLRQTAGGGSGLCFVDWRWQAVAKNLKLKAARAELDYSQEDLAKLVGVSRQTINMIERGDYNPTLNLCLSICHALGKTLDEIFWKDIAELE